MKKSLYILIGLLILASCSKESDENIVDTPLSNPDYIVEDYGVVESEGSTDVQISGESRNTPEL